jgi:hypothetical protein
MMPARIRYQIRVAEVLDSKWEPYFAPFTLTATGDGSILTGDVQDQAELFGILLKIRDLGLKLITVEPHPPG